MKPNGKAFRNHSGKCLAHNTCGKFSADSFFLFNFSLLSALEGPLMQALNASINFSCALTDVCRGECGKSEAEKASFGDLNIDMILIFLPGNGACLWTMCKCYIKESFAKKRNHGGENPPKHLQ